MAPVHADENVVKYGTIPPPTNRRSTSPFFRGGLGDGDAAVIRAHIADVAEMERDRNGVEGIIESGVANAVVVGVEEGQAGDAAVSFGDE